MPVAHEQQMVQGSALNHSVTSQGLCLFTANPPRQTPHMKPFRKPWKQVRAWTPKSHAHSHTVHTLSTHVPNQITLLSLPSKSCNSVCYYYAFVEVSLQCFMFWAHLA